MGCITVTANVQNCIEVTPNIQPRCIEVSIVQSPPTIQCDFHGQQKYTLGTVSIYMSVMYYEGCSAGHTIFITPDLAGFSFGTDGTFLYLWGSPYSHGCPRLVTGDASNYMKILPNGKVSIQEAGTPFSYSVFFENEPTVIEAVGTLGINWELITCDSLVPIS